ncbi:hypothetical protein [Candidatus Magnetobacterium casense]|uniref:Uncharacterized protein n=1 Tax=Candidatus Magnetobacterium casense TaxID=1455061 RepID=A0ABS6S1N1_9BACT|nr:hypothetical protein [Candidatus Magnetobacterium casensis]MBV6342318.1 hypothetical protein [Candidatus Magnetobacterium casensis]
MWSNLGIERVDVRPEVGRRVPESDHPRKDAVAWHPALPPLDLRGRLTLDAGNLYTYGQPFHFFD